MASVFNRGLKFSVFGESHGKAVGVVIDNVPAGIELNFNQMRAFMKRRAPVSFKIGASTRFETDDFEILSGVFKGKTSGSPICAVILNRGQNSNSYKNYRNLIRPGHADFTARARYGGFNDSAGAGHLSGRLTAPLVFVGAFCEQVLLKHKIKSVAHVSSVGKIHDFSFNEIKINLNELEKLKTSQIPVLNEKVRAPIEREIMRHRCSGNSIGGTIECAIFGVEAGLGSPMFDKIENYLADLVFAIPAVKAIEFGAGFKVAKMTGFENNDEFYVDNNGKIKTKTNNCGGVLGGISTSMPIVFKVAVKPTPTIFRVQNTVDVQSKRQVRVSFKGKHDCCIVLRAVVVVEAVANIAMVAQLINQGRLKMEGCEKEK